MLHSWLRILEQMAVLLDALDEWCHRLEKVHVMTTECYGSHVCLESVSLCLWCVIADLQWWFLGICRSHINTMMHHITTGCLLQSESCHLLDLVLFSVTQVSTSAWWGIWPHAACYLYIACRSVWCTSSRTICCTVFKLHWEWGFAFKAA